MSKWFTSGASGSDDDEAGKLVEKKFGEVDQTLKTLNESQSKVTETLGTLAESVKAINDRAAAEDKKLKDAAEAERRKAASAVQNQSADEKFERFASDPDRYFAEQMAPAARVALITAAKMARSETLGVKEYYYGDVKAKVDALIDSSDNLAQRANPDYINNCYKIILADHLQDIQEGKLKKQLSAQNFSDGSGSGKSGSDSNAKPSIEYEDNKSRHAAAQMGLTDDDFIGAAKSRTIRGLEVVA